MENTGFDTLIMRQAVILHSIYLSPVVLGRKRKYFYCLCFPWGSLILLFSTWSQVAELYIIVA